LFICNVLHTKIDHGRNKRMGVIGVVWLEKNVTR